MEHDEYAWLPNKWLFSPLFVNFAEICLLTDARRVASVRAETYCNLYALDRTSFQDVLQNYPFMRRTLESVAAERLHQLGRDPLQVIHRKNLQEDLEIVKEIVSQVIDEFQLYFSYVHYFSYNQSALTYRMTFI